MISFKPGKVKQKLLRRLPKEVTDRIRVETDRRAQRVEITVYSRAVTTTNKTYSFPADALWPPLVFDKFTSYDKIAARILLLA